MLMSTLEKDVIDIVVEQLGVDAADVSLEKSFIEDLNADSLDLTELIMTFEEKFGFEISEEEAEKLKTVGDVVRDIEQITGQRLKTIELNEPGEISRLSLKDENSFHYPYTPWMSALSQTVQWYQSLNAGSTSSAP